LINRVIVVGRLTRDPELRYAPNGTAVTKFTVACDRYGDGADFIPVTVFKKTAEACANNLNKGRLVGIEGRWQTGSYETNEGKKVYTNDLIADNVRFLDSGNRQDNRQAGTTSEGDPFQGEGQTYNEDDLPF
jgi:single-strand DNA-binding protein